MSTVSKTGIFQQLANEDLMMNLVRREATNPIGFYADVLTEAVADPSAFAAACVNFAKTMTEADMVAVGKARKVAADIAGKTAQEIVPDLDKKLIEILNAISPETIEKASTTFAQFVKQVEAGDLDSFRFLTHEEPSEAWLTQNKILYQINKRFDSQQDILKEEDKKKFEDSETSLSLNGRPMAPWRMAVQDKMFTMLREIREEILGESDPTTAPFVKDLLNTRLIPHVFYIAIAPFIWEPRIPLRTDRETIKNDFRKVIAQELGSKPLRESLARQLPETSVSASSPEDFLGRVVPALIRSIEETPVSQDAADMNGRISFVGLILRHNLARIAKAAIAETK